MPTDASFATLNGSQAGNQIGITAQPSPGLPMNDKPKQGRPPKPADQQTKPYSIRLTEAEILKLKVIGMDRLRAWLRNTKTEKPLAGTNQT